MLRTAIFLAALPAASGLRRKQRQGAQDTPDPALCDAEEIEGFCEALGFKDSDYGVLDHAAAVEGLRSYFAIISEEDIQRFMRSARVIDDEFTCGQLCAKTIEFGTRRGFTFPPTSGAVCLDSKCVEMVDLSNDALIETVLEDVKEASAAQEPSQGKMHFGNLPKRAAGNDTAEVDISYDVDEVFESLAMAFKVNPIAPQKGARARGGTFDETPFEVPRSTVTAHFGKWDPHFSSEIRKDRQKTWIAYTAKARGIIQVALNRLSKKSEMDVGRRWLGGAAGAKVFEMREMFNKMLLVLNKATIKKGRNLKDECEEGVLAYVFQYERGAVFVHGDGPQIPENNGRYVIHICEYFWSVASKVQYKYGTLIHEASHHWGTTDTGYGKIHAKREARTKPNAARTNADNWMWSVLDLASHLDIWTDSVDGELQESHLHSTDGEQEKNKSVKKSDSTDGDKVETVVHKAFQKGQKVQAKIGNELWRTGLVELVLGNEVFVRPEGWSKSHAFGEIVSIDEDEEGYGSMHLYNTETNPGDHGRCKKFCFTPDHGGNEACELYQWACGMCTKCSGSHGLRGFFAIALVLVSTRLNL